LPKLGDAWMTVGAEEMAGLLGPGGMPAVYQGLEPRARKTLIAAPACRQHGRFRQLGDDPRDDRRRRREDAAPLHRRVRFGPSNTHVRLSLVHAHASFASNWFGVAAHILSKATQRCRDRGVLQ
jgi:hypothetical protein